MTLDDSVPRARPFETADAKSDFRCGKHSLDDYFHRHATTNDAQARAEWERSQNAEMERAADEDLRGAPKRSATRPLSTGTIRSGGTS